MAVNRSRRRKIDDLLKKVKAKATGTTTTTATPTSSGPPPGVPAVLVRLNSKFDGQHCASCQRRISIGDPIGWDPARKGIVYCDKCSPHAAPPKAPPAAAQPSIPAFWTGSTTGWYDHVGRPLNAITPVLEGVKVYSQSRQYIGIVQRDGTIQLGSKQGGTTPPRPSPANPWGPPRPKPWHGASYYNAAGGALDVARAPVGSTVYDAPGSHVGWVAFDPRIGVNYVSTVHPNRATWSQPRPAPTTPPPPPKPTAPETNAIASTAAMKALVALEEALVEKAATKMTDELRTGFERYTKFKARALHTGTPAPEAMTALKFAILELVKLVY